jgi:hypothetical protein
VKDVKVKDVQVKDGRRVGEVRKEDGERKKGR